MRELQHEQFADFLEDIQFYKNYHAVVTKTKVVEYVDTHAITYWGVVSCIFDHLVNHTAYFDRIEDNIPYLLTLEHITGIINSYTEMNVGLI